MYREDLLAGITNYLDDANLAYKFLVSGLSLVYISGRRPDQRNAFSECDSGVTRPKFSVCKSQSKEVVI